MRPLSCPRLISCHAVASRPTAASCHTATSNRQRLCPLSYKPLDAPHLFSGWLLHLRFVTPPPLATLLLSSDSCRAAATCCLPLTACGSPLAASRSPLAVSTSRPLAGCRTATSQTTSASHRTPLVLLIIISFTLTWLFQHHHHQLMWLSGRPTL